MKPFQLREKMKKEKNKKNPKFQSIHYILYMAEL